MNIDKIGFFGQPGAYFLVDGQYGSTGKGLAAAYLAEQTPRDLNVSISSNAGPNSGHTFYHKGQKHVLMQLPSFGVFRLLDGVVDETIIHLNAGAVLAPDRLREEISQYVTGLMTIHPRAAVVTPESISDEANIKDRIGSTGKGTGAAITAKVMRNPAAVAGAGHKWARLSEGVRIVPQRFRKHQYVFVEVSQGFSLGINQRFYPYCTSRECTVSQALSDAGLHPFDFRKCMMVVRTYPIRVGGNSGPFYPDQEEIEWSTLGIEPETTTVTGKQRRLFTWSAIQFREALRANRPDHIFLNFCNYLAPSKVENFVWRKIIEPYEAEFGCKPEKILLGFGPENHDVKEYHYENYSKRS